MLNPSQTSGLSAPPCPGEPQSRLKRAEIAYRSMTVAAIVLLLCSLWVF